MLDRDDILLVQCRIQIISLIEGFVIFSCRQRLGVIRIKFQQGFMGLRLPNHEFMFSLGLFIN